MSLQDKSFEELVEMAYDKALLKYGDTFENADSEEKHCLMYPFYVDLCDQQQAEYWDPVIRNMEQYEMDEFDRQEQTRRLNGF